VGGQKAEPGRGCVEKGLEPDFQPGECRLGRKTPRRGILLWGYTDLKKWGRKTIITMEGGETLKLSYIEIVFQEAPDASYSKTIKKKVRPKTKSGALRSFWGGVA